MSNEDWLSKDKGPQWREPEGPPQGGPDQDGHGGGPGSGPGGGYGTGPGGGYGTGPGGGYGTGPGGGYGTGPGGGYGGGMPKPDNFLVWAILSTVLCCLPLGVVSIVFATQVDSKWLVGDTHGALEASRKAKTFAIASAITTAALIVLYVLFLVAVAVFGDSSSSYDYSRY